MTDSIPSSDKNLCTHNTAGKSASAQNTTNVDTGTSSCRQGYFVPLIMLIVLTAIVFATFFDKWISKQIADLAPLARIPHQAAVAW